MIGKPEWFRRRKYTGWGFTPVTWQGWVYVFVMVLPIILLANLYKVSQAWLGFVIVWAVVFCVDFIHIVSHLPKDERDRMHEAIAERNALWAIVAVLAVGVAYQAASVAVSQDMTKVDPVILVAIFAGLIAKAVSNIYLDKKD
jgi:putative Mn2+ efflux pump MntP